MPQEWIMQEALELWGEDAQLLMVVEEMGELSHEILKYLRCNPLLRSEARKKIAAEHADVNIMLDQLAFMMGKYDIEGSEYSKMKREFTVEKVLRLVNNLDRTKEGKN